MKPILFFDGVCVMCNGLVDFVLKHDRNKRLKFAPLQGTTAKNMVPNHVQKLESVVFIDNDGLHTESEAIIRLLIEMGGIFRWAAILRIFPRFFRNFVYRLVAKHRYKLFGKNASCRMSTADEKKRILE